MKSFPDLIHVNNVDTFATLHYERVKAYLRRDIYELIISNPYDYTNGQIADTFSINGLDRKYRMSVEVLQKMLVELAQELEQLGWAYEIVYGHTAIFIFPPGNKPPNCCWSADDELS